MIDILFSKAFIYGVISLLVTGIFSYSLYSWHYGVIGDLKSDVEKLTLSNKAKDNTIKNLGVEIIQLIENNKVVGFEEYFNGFAENNNSFSDSLIF